MDRIYTDYRHGQHRIHIEIADHEIADLLDDLGPTNSDWFETTKHLRRLLKSAQQDFASAQAVIAREADTDRT